MKFKQQKLIWDLWYFLIPRIFQDKVQNQDLMFIKDAFGQKEIFHKYSRSCKKDIASRSADQFHGNICPIHSFLIYFRVWKSVRAIFHIFQE